MMRLRPRQRLFLLIIFLINFFIFSVFGILLYTALQSEQPAVALAQASVTANTGTSLPASATPDSSASLAPIVALDTSTPSETPLPVQIPTRPALTYTIVAGDTVWAVAARFNVPVETILAANPGLNPDQVFPGNVILIPDITPTASPTPLPTVTETPTLSDGQVTDDGEGLRLRQAPGTAGFVLAFLNAATPLQIVGRTQDSAWLEVIVPDGHRGWVMGHWVATSLDLSSKPVTGVAMDVPAATASVSATSRAVAAITATLNPLLPKPPSPTSAPPAFPAPALPAYISNLTARARQIFLAGQAQGNNANAFALVGDSNTDNPAFFAPFDNVSYNLGDYAYLQPTLDHFRGFFGHHSPAAVGSFNTSKVLDPTYADSSRCWGGESPLVCEYRLQRPGVALILLGTGDHHTWQGFELRYRQIVDYTISSGIVPVLITKADDLEAQENTAPPGYINEVIRRLSREYGVPLLDLRLAVEPLPNRGFLPDGFHYNSPPDGRTVDFTGEHLNYGFTMRNLTALQVLDAVRRLVMY